MPAISVIVPVYNVEAYLNRCVDSILAQTFQDFELILVDDGSPDNCGKISDEYASSDGRITVIHQNNGGLSAARNSGIDHVFRASGSSWITFIDSDDWVHPLYLETLFSAVKNTNCQISICDYCRTDDVCSSQVISDMVKKMTPEELLITDRTVATIACGKLYNRSLFEQIRYPVGKTHEDEYVTYKLLFACEQIAFVNSELYYYFINPLGITKKKWSPPRADCLPALNAQCSYFRKNGYKRAESLSAECLMISCVEALNNLTAYFPDEKKLIKKVRRLFRRAYLKYRSSVSDLNVISSSTYIRLTYPGLEKLRKKGKHAMIFVRGLFNA